MLAKSRVTSKFQVTIPKEVREKVEVRPGEVVVVEAVSHDEIRVRLYPRISNPLKTLIGTRAFQRPIPIEELEEKVESR